MITTACAMRGITETCLPFGYIAELTAAFVTAGLGMASEPHTKTASYIASWISLLKDDKRALFTAAAQASKAADYLTGKSR